jgi:hypothetical protein
MTTSNGTVGDQVEGLGESVNDRGIKSGRRVAQREQVSPGRLARKRRPRPR